MPADSGVAVPDPQQRVQYQPDESPPHLLSLGFGAQATLMIVGGVVLTPAIVVRAAGGTEAFLSWAVFGTLLVSGLATVLQALKVGRVGAGYILFMGTSGAFIAVSITALAEGGPGLLAALVVASSLFQFLFAARLSFVRRVVTPMVAGVVIMLISVTVTPIAFDMLDDVPQGAPAVAAPVSAGLTLVAILVVGAVGTGVVRLWAPLIGIGVGGLAAGFFGLYDLTAVIAAPWFGVPAVAWPGLDLDLGPGFWALLPAFAFVTLVGAVETVGDSIAVQRVSWRRPRAANFREVQGAVNADGVGNLLSGLIGTVPNTTYSSSVAVVEITGVAARRAGVYAGVLLALLAFLPKLAALLLAVPNPVFGAFTLMMMGMLFVQGMRLVIASEIDSKQAMVVGLAFWLGVGFQNQDVFHDLMNARWASLLENGMTVGGFFAIVATLLLELLEPRRSRLRIPLSQGALPDLHRFLDGIAERASWSASAAGRLRLAGEEVLARLVELRPRSDSALLVLVRRDREGAELEFVAAPSGANVEDQMLVLDGKREFALDDVSLRLLDHAAESVRHQQYYDTDFITVRVRGGPEG